MFRLELLVPIINLLGTAVVAVVGYKYRSVVGVCIESALRLSTLADAAKSSPEWKDGDLGMPPCVPVSRPPMTCPCANVECTIVYYPGPAIRHSRPSARPYRALNSTPEMIQPPSQTPPSLHSQHKYKYYANILRDVASNIID